MGKRILLADDEPGIRTTISARLKHAGYDVKTANDGEDALKKMRSWRPDLLIVDMSMPKKGGYDVCREMKASEELQTIPIILLSAYTTDKTGDEAGIADLHFRKPCPSERLLPAIEELLAAGGSEPGA